MFGFNLQGEVEASRGTAWFTQYRSDRMSSLYGTAAYLEKFVRYYNVKSKCENGVHIYFLNSTCQVFIANKTQGEGLLDGSVGVGTCC